MNEFETTDGGGGSLAIPMGAAEPRRDGEWTTRAARRGPDAVATAASLAIVMLAFLCAYAPNLSDLYRTWTNDPNYSHGFLVVPIAVVILRRQLNGVELGELRGWPWGWLVLALVLTTRAFFYEWGIEWRETATLPLVLGGLALTWGGWPLMRRAWPGLAFLVFMLPLPPKLNNALAQPLQRVATAGTCMLLKLTGLWVVPEGNVLLVGKDQLEVAEACNGLSMLMCLAATVAATTILIPMAMWKRFALIASIVPIALLSNILRITATSWCYHLLGAKVGGHYAHDAAGWLMMPTALLLVGLELATFSWLITERPAGASPGRSASPLAAQSSGPAPSAFDTASRGSS